MKNLILPPAMRLLAACFALCGSAQAATFTVTNTGSTGPGSLSQAVADAAALAGPDTLLFDPNLSGQTLTLTSGEISLNTTLSIDASALAVGLTISGNNAGRIFNIGASGNVTLVGLTLNCGGTTRLSPTHRPPRRLAWP